MESEFIYAPGKLFNCIWLKQISFDFRLSNTYFYVKKIELEVIA